MMVGAYSLPKRFFAAMVILLFGRRHSAPAPGLPLI
jgi:hypothetical protein